MRLCYSSFLTTIYMFYDKTKSFKLREINNMLISSIDDTYSRVTDGVIENQDRFASDLKNGHEDIKKQLKLKAQEKGISGILEGVQKYCSPIIAQPNNNLLMLVLNQLVIQSNNIDSSEYIISEPTKISKMNMTFVDSLNMDIYLANLLHYIFINAIPDKNKFSKTGFDSRNHLSDFNESVDFDSLVNEAKQATTPYVNVSPLITVEDYDFNKCFFEISHPIKLTSKSPNDLKLYCLDVDSEGLNYTELEEFITLNIGNYIYSRNQIQEMYDANRVKLIGRDALKEFKKSKVFNGDELGNILLYSFLEYILKAPKLFSNYEIDKHNISSSHAIHIQSVNDGTTPHNILIFGTSNIYDTFIEAFNNSINNLIEIKKNEEGKYKFVNSSIFSASFDYATASQLKDIILPSEHNHTYAEAGYAIFIGYKVDITRDDFDTSEEYVSALKNKMIDDVKSNYTLIEQSIINSKLNKRSIYIYILPFNEPSKDKSSIIEDITTL